MRRKILALLILTMFLVTGCRSKIDEDITIHKDIRDEIAEDSYEVMEMVGKKVNEGKNIDMDTLAKYEGKYYDEGRIHFKEEDISSEEDSIILITLLMANPNSINDFMGAGDHNDKNFEDYQRAWYDTLRTGELKSITNN